MILVFIGSEGGFLRSGSGREVAALPGKSFVELEGFAVHLRRRRRTGPERSRNSDANCRVRCRRRWWCGQLRWASSFGLGPRVDSGSVPQGRDLAVLKVVRRTELYL